MLLHTQVHPSDVGWKNCGMTHFVTFACFPQEVRPTKFPAGCAPWELGAAVE